MFQEWKNAILDKVRQKLDSFPAYAYNAVLTKPQVMAELDRLKDQFVFVPIDKASNNVAVVCKKFYVEVLHGEINSNTYQQSSESVDDIIERHGDHCGNKRPEKHSTKIKIRSVERGVALTADSVKRRRTADTQLMCALFSR